MAVAMRGWVDQALRMELGGYMAGVAVLWVAVIALFRVGSWWRDGRGRVKGMLPFTAAQAEAAPPGITGMGVAARVVVQ